ncbi:MAG: HPF/RaiA family ribosome-associated protein [Pirellulales bacterium]|nr:HPF/RaiA family ribosome-associated protein [Pirellulales bacterium]
MQVEIVTDNHIDGSERLSSYVTGVLEDALARFGDRVTWVEVHLGDENSHKSGGSDKWCGMHVKLGGLPTVNINAEAPTVDLAIDGAIDKLLKTLERQIGKQQDHKGRTPMAGDTAL